MTAQAVFASSASRPNMLMSDAVGTTSGDHFLHDFYQHGCAEPGHDEPFNTAAFACHRSPFATHRD